MTLTESSGFFIFVLFEHMRIFLYNLFIRLYNLGIHLISPFHDKAHSFVIGRRKIFSRIEREIIKGAPIVWFHCASLGEFEQGRPIIEKFREDYPKYKILLSFYSPSGYEVRKNYQHADYIFYLPIDTKRNAQKWISLIKPTAAFFIKYEFWHHYINELNQNNIPIFSVSSIFRENQIFFKKYGKFNRNILQKFSYFFVQDKQSIELLDQIGIKNKVISGDTRFDRVKAIRGSVVDIPMINIFKNNHQAFIIGSSWQDDLDVLAPFINQSEDNLKFIIAPHEVYEMGIKNIEKQIDRKTIRYSQANEEDIGNFEVLIIDNVGMLSSLYQYGDYAYIGGAFGKGLHNILEAATFGMPIFFGNKSYKKFREARELIQLEGAFAIADYHELKEKYSRLNHDVSSMTTQSYVEGNIGATEKIMSYCKNYLN